MRKVWKGACAGAPWKDCSVAAFEMWNSLYGLGSYKEVPRREGADNVVKCQLIFQLPPPPPPSLSNTGAPTLICSRSPSLSQLFLHLEIGRDAHKRYPIQWIPTYKTSVIRLISALPVSQDESLISMMTSRSESESKLESPLRNSSKLHAVFW